MFASGMVTAAAIGTEADAAAFGTDARELGVLEWRVVALARSEADRFGRAAIAERGFGRRLLARLTGLGGGVVRLADERLETLRRFVCLVRRADGRAGSTAVTLAAFGFSAGAIHAVAAAATR